MESQRAQNRFADRVRGWCRRTAAMLLVASSTAGAQSASTNPVDGVTCPSMATNSAILSTTICWTCMFPIRIAGVPIGGPATNVPRGAASPMCVCPGAFGIPSPGFTIGMWQPQRLVELVRQPYCSPTLGKVMAHDFKKWGGYQDSAKNEDNRPYYNFHYFIFPAGIVFNRFTDAVCTGGSGYDLDLLFISEIDPAWNNDELALFVTPEATLFANPLAIGACMVDSATSAFVQPIDELFWCMGSWGHMYPFAGTSVLKGSPVRASSADAVHGLSFLHRMGLAKKTMGDDAVCSDHPYPITPKTQYKFEMLFPIAESISNHWIGENTFRWGEWRNIPYKGEDFVYLNWYWQDCCRTSY